MTATLNEAPPTSPTAEAPPRASSPRRGGRFDGAALGAIFIGLVGIAALESSRTGRRVTIAELGDIGG